MEFLKFSTYETLEMVMSRLRANKMVNAWIMPRIATKDYGKSGQVSQFAITREKGRANRFNVNFQLGSLAACPADAERIITDALNILCWKIQENWRSGLSAAGWTLKKPKRKGRKIPGIPWRRVSYEQAGKYENQSIDKTMKFSARTEKNAKNIDAQKAWSKSVKKNFTYKKELMRPPLNVTPEEKIVGHWSGLLSKSLTIATVRIKSKKGRVPQMVRTRITVAPSRADAMKSMKMFDIVEGGDNTWSFVHDFIARAVKQTVIYRNWDNARPITQNEINKKYNDFFRRHMTSAKVMKMLTRTLTKGYGMI
jgi:hypothetical protein